MLNVIFKKGDRTMARGQTKVNPGLAMYNKMKRWSGELGIGALGVKKDMLVQELVKVMSERKDELNEEQLAWLADNTNEKPRAKKTRKTRRIIRKTADEAAVEEKPKRKRGRPPKKKVEEVKVEPETIEPTEEEIGVIRVDFTLSEVKGFAREVGVDTRGIRHEKQGQKLAQKVYDEINLLADEEKEELSKDCFKFYTSIQTQIEEVTEAEEKREKREALELEMPVPAKIKVWAGALGVNRKGKTDEEVLKEILEIYETEVEEEDKEDLPDSLVEWAERSLEGEAVVKLPDFDTLKVYARAVGLGLRGIKEAKKDPETLASMVLEAFNEEEKDDYPPELLDFYFTVTGETEPEVTEPVEEEEVEEEFDVPIKDWLEECGYDRDDLDNAETGNELVEVLKQEYEEESTRDIVPDEAVEYLKTIFPDMFKKEISKKKPRKITRK